MRYIWLLIIASLLLLATGWWQKQLLENLTEPLPVPAPAPAEKAVDQEPARSLDQEREQFEAEQSEVRAISGITEDQAEPQALWHIDLESQPHTVDFDRALIESVATGEALTLALPNGESVNAIVTTRIRRPSGNLHVKAVYDFQGQQYAAMFTQSKEQTFATLPTPEGIYELTARNGQGTLVNSIELEHRQSQPESDMMPSHQ